MVGCMAEGNWLVEGECLYLNKWMLFLPLQLHSSAKIFFKAIDNRCQGFVDVEYRIQGWHLKWVLLLVERAQWGVSHTIPRLRTRRIEGLFLEATINLN